MPIPSFTAPPGADSAPPLELINLVAQFIVARAVGVCELSARPASSGLGYVVSDWGDSAQFYSGICGL